MSLSKGKVVLEPVLQPRQRTLLGQKSQEWDRYFKSVGLSKLADLLIATPLIEEMVYEFFDTFDLEKSTSCVQGRVIRICPETFEVSLGAAFGSDGRGHSGYVPPNRVWDAPRGWNNRFGDEESRRDTQRSDGWRMKALKSDKKNVYTILSRAILMKCDCTHISNAFATALVKAEEGGENDHGVNWAAYCYNSFVKEMQRIAKSNGKAIKTVTGHLVCKILSDSGVALPSEHSSAQLGAKPASPPMREFGSETGGDSQSKEECIIVDPAVVKNVTFKRRAGEQQDVECKKKPRLASSHLPPPLDMQPDSLPMSDFSSQAGEDSQSDGDCVLLSPIDVESFEFEMRAREPLDQECNKEPNFASPDLPVCSDLCLTSTLSLSPASGSTSSTLTSASQDCQDESLPWNATAVQERSVISVSNFASPHMSLSPGVSLWPDPSLFFHLPLNPGFGSGGSTLTSVSQEDGSMQTIAIAGQRLIRALLMAQWESDLDVYNEVQFTSLHDLDRVVNGRGSFRRHYYYDDSAPFRSREESFRWSTDLWYYLYAPADLLADRTQEQIKHAKLRAYLCLLFAFSAGKLSSQRSMRAQAVLMDLWQQVLLRGYHRMCRAIILQHCLGGWWLMECIIRACASQFLPIVMSALESKAHVEDVTLGLQSTPDNPLLPKMEALQRQRSGVAMPSPTPVTVGGVKVHPTSKSLVVPAVPTERDWLPLSNLDRVVNPTFSSIILLYKDVVDSATSFKEVTKLLKESLAKVLVNFYPLAGRLALGEDGMVEFHCNDEGVLFFEASVEAELRAVHDGDPKTALSGLHLAGLGPAPNYIPDQLQSMPALVIMVAKFTCGSIAIAVNRHHPMADGSAGCHSSSPGPRCSPGYVSLVNGYSMNGIDELISKSAAEEKNVEMRQLVVK